LCVLYVFLFCGVMVATWFVVLRLAQTGTAREKERVRSAMRAAVRRSIGLEIDGDPIGSYAMRGEVHGVETSIDGKMMPSLPGASPYEHVGVTAITVRASLPDQIVCRRFDVDKVMGSLPSMPPRATGDPLFDGQFAVFIGVGPTQEEPAGYRDPPAGVSRLAWADPRTLGEMTAQHLLFLRVRDGACQIAFPPTPAHEIGPLVATAANVARRASGEPLVAAPTASTFIAPARSFDSAAWVTALAPPLLFFTPLAFVIAFFPPLRALNAEAECGVGGEIRVSSNDVDGEGTSYGLHCWNNGSVSGPPMIGHYASAVAICVAIIFGVVTAIALARWPAKAPDE
jgi:hypothetical protein